MNKYPKVKLSVRPVSLKQANEFVENLHRHHRKTQGHKFSEGCFDENDVLHGVAIVGRPVSRFLDDGCTLEVTRLCTDGTFNACSILYSRCAKIAKEMGYTKIITYILEEEQGTSLKASGWTLEENNVGGGSWDDCSRREDKRNFQQISLFEEREKYPIGKKKRYCKIL